MALVCFRPKYVFCHIYNTGGTIVRSVFKKELELGSYHSPLSEIRKDIIEGKYIGSKVTPIFLGSAYKFSFVRNPFDWQVSLYHLIKKDTSHWGHNEVVNLNFEGYLDWYKELMIEKRLVGKTREDRLLTQSDFLCNEHGVLLTNFVGRYENFISDIRKVLKKLWLKIPEKIPTPKCGQPRRSENIISHEAAKKILRIFKSDFIIFGYPTEDRVIKKQKFGNRTIIIE